MKHSEKKNRLTITLIVLAALVAVGVMAWFFWLKDLVGAVTSPPVQVTKVSDIAGLDTGVLSRYTGVVEPQKTHAVTKDDSRTVAEVLVAPGDEVNVGDVLFRYDTEEIGMSITQAELDLEGIDNQLSTLRTQLETLNDEKETASEDNQYSYTVQIQSVELEIRSTEQSRAQKNAELEKLRQTLSNASVTSPAAGMIQEINENGATDAYGNPKPYISILSSTEFLVKGTVSELNISSLYEGMDVTVISRIDPAFFWTGTIDTVEQEPTSDMGSNYYYYGMNSGEQSSKYNFYVTLNDPQGLILGQHVYIEPSYGFSAQKTGLWLPGVYVVADGTDRYVWAENDSGRLERRKVVLGDYDANEDLCQITSGLSRQDSIAYPTEDLFPGMPTADEAAVAPAEDGMGGATAPGGSITIDGGVME